MSEIKFRGKRVDNGEWVEGCYAFSKIPLMDGIDHFIIVDGLKPYKVDPETVGQYTGIKNTYEWDILPPDEQWGEATIICYDVHQACYKRVPISLYKTNSGNGGWSGMPLRWHSPEPIGNRFDNPDLLGEVRE